MQNCIGLLKQLRGCTKLSSATLQDYFDCASGWDKGVFPPSGCHDLNLTQIGMFFVLTMFVQGWQIEDCSHHSKNVRYPKIRRGVISFGGKLSWDLLSQLDRCNMALDADSKVLHSGPMAVLVLPTFSAPLSH